MRKIENVGLGGRLSCTMFASAKASSLYDAWSPRLLSRATWTAESTVRVRRRSRLTASWARSASSEVRIEITSFLIVSAATSATTVMPPSGENVAHPDRTNAESKTIVHEGLYRSRLGTVPKFLYIARLPIRLRRWSGALVLLPPRRRSGRAKAGVGSNRRTVPNTRDFGAGVGRIGAD